VAHDALSAPETVFYDGHCGLCHGVVKFVLNRDRLGTMFRFAPLQGQTFQRLAPPAERVRLPDSIVVQTSSGVLLARSSAVLHILRRLGGGWKTAAWTLTLVPGPLRDAGYDLVAAVRYRVFGKRDDLCPVIPRELRERFDP